MPLEPEDQRHITAAIGYVELGMYLDANDELEEIDPYARAMPEVLAVRVSIYSGLKKWELMQVVTKKLAQYDPDNVQWWISLAYATRRLESIDAAKVILFDALKRHPKKPSVHFNMACYDCQLGDLESAKQYLKQCFDLDNGWRIHALEDTDLEPLWDSLRDVAD